MPVRKTETGHVAGVEPDVAETAAFGLIPGDGEQPFREIDAEDLPVRPDSFGGGKRRGAAAATDIEDVHAGLQPGEFDRAPPGSLPEAERRVVEMVGGGVVGGRRLQFSGVRLHARRIGQACLKNRSALPAISFCRASGLMSHFRKLSTVSGNWHSECG